MKKLLTLLMATVMMFALATSAWAADVDVTQDGTYTTIDAAITATEGNGKVTLMTDVVEDVVIDASETITIDLNGYEITNVSDHTITNYGTLTIIDGSEDGTGSVDVLTHQKAAVYNAAGATATLEGGTYLRSDETKTTNSYYTVQNKGTITMDGTAYVYSTAASASCFANDEGGIMYMKGGNVYSKSYVGVVNRGTFEMTGGELYGSSSDYALHTWSKATVSSGTISGKTMVQANYGADIYGDLTITGDAVATNLIYVEDYSGDHYGTEVYARLTVSGNADIYGILGQFDNGSYEASYIHITIGADDGGTVNIAGMVKNLTCGETIIDGKVNFNSTYVYVGDDDETFNANATFTVNQGAVLYLGECGGTNAFFNCGTLINNGTITNDGYIESTGTIENNGTITNNGIITSTTAVTGTGSVTGNAVQTSIVVYSIEDMYTALANDAYTDITYTTSVTADKTYYLTDGMALTIPEGKTLHFTNKIYVKDGATLTLEDDATIDVLYLHVEDGGTLTMGEDATFDCSILYIYKGSNLTVGEGCLIDCSSNLYLYEGNTFSVPESAQMIVSKAYVTSYDNFLTAMRYDDVTSIYLYGGTYDITEDVTLAAGRKVYCSNVSDEVITIKSGVTFTVSENAYCYFSAYKTDVVLEEGAYLAIEPNTSIDMKGLVNNGTILISSETTLTTLMNSTNVVQGNIQLADDLTITDVHGTSNSYTYSVINGANLIIPEDITMTIDENVIFTVAEGGTITNYGTLNIEGTLDNDGIIYNAGTISGTEDGIIYDAVAKIDDEIYFGLQDAITAADADDTVTLIADVTEEITFSETPSLTLDLNGYTVTGNITNSGTLSIVDSGENGIVTGTITNNEGGTIAIAGGLFTQNLDSTWAATGYEMTTVTVEGTEYYVVQPAAEVEYSVIGNTIYAKLNGDTVGTLSVLAPTELEYDGSTKEAYIVDENSGVLGSQTIVYNTTDGTAPTEAGTYTASITAVDGEDSFTASITFTISRVSVSFTSSNNSFEQGKYDGEPTIEPSIDGFTAYEVSYTDADGNEVDLDSTTPVGTYTIVVTITNSNYKLSGTVGSVVVYETELPKEYTVTYDYNDEGATSNSTTDSAIATTVRTLADAPTKDGNTFAGWTYNGKIYTAGATFVQPEADVTMTATWIENKMTVSGTVTDNEGTEISGATVTLKDGTKTTTDSDGKYSFSGVAVDTYTISVEYKPDEITYTSSSEVYIKADTTVNFSLQDLTLSTKVVVEAGLEAKTVSNLSEVAAEILSEQAENGAYSEFTEVEVSLIITSSNDLTAISEIADKTEDVGYTVDISIEKVFDNTVVEAVSETPNTIEIEIALPAEIQGMATYKVYRYHVGDDGEGSVGILTTSKNSDGEYIELVKTTMTVEDEDGVESTVDVTTSLIIHAKYFSTYAIASSDTVETTSTSSSSVKKYSNDLEVGDNGSAYATPSSASSGTTVYIYATPDTGYEVDEVLVDDGDITVTDEGDNVYSYKQPAYAVDIEVTFVATDDVEEEEVEADENEALTDFEDVVAGAWYEEYIAAAVEEGIMQGNSSTEFAPNGTTTRAMMIQVLFNLEDQPETENDEAAWYSEALAWGMEFGITDGTEITGNLTREQLVTMLYRYAMSNGVDTSAAGDLTTFGDAENVADWSADAFAWAVGEGIINGDTAGNLNPDGNATRAELAKIMVSYLAL